MSAGQSPRRVQTVARCFASSDWEKAYHSYWNIWLTAWHRSPTAWATHCHRTIINTLCWHLRNNLTQDKTWEDKRSGSWEPFTFAYSPAELVAKQSSVTHCLDESPALPHECTLEFHIVCFTISTTHFVPFFFVFPWQIRIFKLHFMTRINADTSLPRCGVWRWAFFRDFKR